VFQTNKPQIKPSFIDLVILKIINSV